MRIDNLKSLNNVEIINLLNKNGISASEKSFLFGGNHISASNGDFSVIIKNKGAELTIELNVPVWVRIVSFLVAIIVASIILTAIVGDVVIVQGGFIVILIGLFAGDSIYKSSKSDVFKSFCEIISEKFNN